MFCLKLYSMWQRLGISKFQTLSRYKIRMQFCWIICLSGPWIISFSVDTQVKLKILFMKGKILFWTLHWMGWYISSDGKAAFQCDSICAEVSTDVSYLCLHWWQLVFRWGLLELVLDLLRTENPLSTLLLFVQFLGSLTQEDTSLCPGWTFNWEIPSGYLNAIGFSTRCFSAPWFNVLLYIFYIFSLFVPHPTHHFLTLLSPKHLVIETLKLVAFWILLLLLTLSSLKKISIFYWGCDLWWTVQN